MLIVLAGLIATGQTLAAEPVIVSAPHHEDRGVLVHTVESPYQPDKTEIRVLVPGEMAKGKQLPVIYVLPVEPHRENRFGDGLVEVRKHDLHNKHRVIFVAPTFAQLPWYADHPCDASIRQESLFVKVVVPFVEKTYPASTNRADRRLLGFSKSGWGAWSLLVRHPEMFGRAAAWDAPLMMSEIGLYGNRDILGSHEKFLQYSPAELLRSPAASLREHKRFVLTGYGNFREHHRQAHTLLDELNIPHVYRDGPQREHNWHSGWVTEAVDLLMESEEDAGC